MELDFRIADYEGSTVPTPYGSASDWDVMLIMERENGYMDRRSRRKGGLKNRA